ncbi:MAG TPA: maleylpyruvate isomerase family mycothiol-dependent enzyme [Streptosporangiaceae bacterium]
MEIMDLIAAQREDLATILGGLPEQTWGSPTLCELWRIREVVAHMTMPFRYSGEEFMAELGESGGDFTALSNRLAARDAAALSPAELTETIRVNVRHPWEPPGGGLAGALSHDVIHGLDITVPLGAGFTVPEERLRAVLPPSPDEMSVKFFGTDLDGIELRATDMDWTFGTGAPLTGAAQDLLLVICGRKLPTGHLDGEQSERFTAG